MVFFYLKPKGFVLEHCKTYYSHAKMDLSWCLYKKLKIFDRKLIPETKPKWKFFYTILKYSIIPSIWFLICENLIIRSKTVFINVISTNIVDIDFRYEARFTCGKSTLHGNVVNCKNIIMKILDYNFYIAEMHQLIGQF